MTLVAPQATPQVTYHVDWLHPTLQDYVAQNPTVQLTFPFAVEVAVDADIVERQYFHAPYDVGPKSLDLRGCQRADDFFNSCFKSAADNYSEHAGKPNISGVSSVNLDVAAVVSKAGLKALSEACSELEEISFVNNNKGLNAFLELGERSFAVLDTLLTSRELTGDEMVRLKEISDMMDDARQTEIDPGVWCIKEPECYVSEDSA